MAGTYPTKYYDEKELDVDQFDIDQKGVIYTENFYKTDADAEAAYLICACCFGRP